MGSREQEAVTMEAAVALEETGVATEATVEAVPPAEAGRGEVAAQAEGTETVKWEENLDSALKREAKEALETEGETG